MKIQFFVSGRIAPAGSKSVFRNKRTGKNIVAPASKYSKAWMMNVSLAACKAYRDKPFTGPVSFSMIFRFQRPRHHFDKNGVLSKAGRQNLYHTCQPDLTKIVRCTEDALTGIIWKDDSQVVKQVNIKAYCLYGQPSGAEIIIESVADGY